MGKDAADLQSFLPSIALFGGLEEPALSQVIEMMKWREFAPGDQVCKQGETGRDMWLVRSGEVVVCRDNASGRRVKMVRLGAGEFFGEMTLVDIQKRSATVIVDKAAALLSLSNRDLFQLYQQSPATYVLILQNLCRELSRRLRRTNSRLTEQANDDEGTLIRPAVKRTRTLG
jgi:CRP-like cAMP-binding protein